jgi:hypothetical protein
MAKKVEISGMIDGKDSVIFTMDKSGDAVVNPDVLPRLTADENQEAVKAAIEEAAITAYLFDKVDKAGLLAD